MHLLKIKALSMKLKLVLLLSAIVLQCLILCAFNFYLSKKLLFTGDAVVTIHSDISGKAKFIVTGLFDRKESFEVNTGDIVYLSDRWVSELKILLPHTDTSSYIQLSFNGQNSHKFNLNHKQSITINQQQCKYSGSFYQIIKSSISWHTTTGTLMLIFWIIQGLISISLLFLVFYNIWTFFIKTGFYQRNTFCNTFRTYDKEHQLIVKNRKLTFLPVLLIIIYIFTMFYYPSDRKVTHLYEEIKAVLPALEMKIKSENCIPSIKGEPFYTKPQGLSLYYLFCLDTLKIKPSSGNLFVLNQIPNLIFILLLLLILKTEFGFSGASKITLLYLCSSEVMKRFPIIYSDIFFIPLVFLNIAIIYIFLKKGKPKELLYISYAICALAFLFKGLPAIPFHIISLIVGFVLFRQWKTLFSVHHFFAFLISVFIAFSPFIITGNIEKIPSLLNVLKFWVSFHFDEYYVSASLWQRLIEFPLLTIIMFSPFAILVVLFAFPSTYRIIRDNSMAKYSIIVFILNYAIYWFSTRPTAAFISPLIPFLIICIYVCYIKQAPRIKLFADVLLALTAIIIITFIIYTVPGKIDQTFIKQTWIMVSTIVIISLVFALLFIRYKELRIILVAGVFIFAGFFLNKIPDAKTQCAFKFVAQQEEQAKRLCSLSKGNKIYLYDGETHWNEDLLYYLTIENNQINFEKYFQSDKPKYVLINKDQFEHSLSEKQKCRIVSEEEINYYDSKETNANGRDVKKGKSILIVL